MLVGGSSLLELIVGLVEVSDDEELQLLKLGLRGFGVVVDEDRAHTVA